MLRELDLNSNHVHDQIAAVGKCSHRDNAFGTRQIDRPHLALLE